MAQGTRGHRTLRSLAYAATALACVLATVAAPAGATAPLQRTQSVAAHRNASRSASLSQVSTSLGWRLPAFMYDKRLKGLLAYDVVDAATGQIVSARNGYLPVMPASTFKIMTAVVALRLMGPNARSSTDVYELPPADSLPNVTRVTIVGGGDSLLTSANLESLMAPIVDLARSEGNDSVQINIDDSIFPAPTMAYGWLAKYIPSVIAPIRGLERDERRSADTSDEVGRWFTTTIRKYGITASYGGRVRAPLDAVQVASFQGYTTTQLVRSMLLYSDNDIAEHLARLTTIAAGEEPTWSNWSEVARHQLIALHVNVSGLQIYDGSGLSRQDRFTPAAEITLLREALNPSGFPKLRSMLIDPPGSFPVSGSTGTLRLRFAHKTSACARGLVRAKTGFLTGTGGLAGVAKGVDGRTRVFALILNNQAPKVTNQQVVDAFDDMAATITGCTFAGR